MARYTRRRSRRRSSRRKNRRAPRRRTLRKSRRTRSSVNQHTFVRSTEIAFFNDVDTNVNMVSTDSSIIATPATLTGGVNLYLTSDNYWTFIQFQLSQTPNFSEFTALYDQFMIDKVKMIFEYAHNSSDASSLSVPLPKIVTFNDWDDRSAVTYSELQQREAVTHRSTLGRGLVTRTIRPKIKLYGEQTSIPASVSNPGATYKRSWIDCAVPTWAHYGIKLVILDWPDLPAKPILRVRLEYTIKFRNVR